ncbi:MAG: GTP 3',8-cyclase MoaA [Chloroflexi bacterium]|nr:GTP 3',8-cyclase MoaA [Chloroflexota bacterium]MBM3183120.1 GTP 3',8-cyclase MoaA [Chloroflexota bacterium]MBM4451424.1 GTP 3',8-cyclase MoaA [Chloroflexota bacterium]MBM4453097.1 GTP 3',8-cyclase MoaA [Chloroflexota bacterium]
MTGLSDIFNRPINYLRVSVTDRCNLRCSYCMPAQGIRLLSHDDILSYEEIATVARVAAEMGINKLRLTGGEPLVRARLADLVAMIAKIETIDDISLTTNGVLLQEYAPELKKAGLKRVNVSLDTLNPDKFQRITHYRNLDEVLQGIKAARDCGLEPVKINVVVMRGVNDDEILDFARLTIKDGWHVRFIELMPFATENPHEGHATRSRADLHPQFMPAKEIMERLHSLGKLESSDTMKGNGPARYYRFPKSTGTVGFITPVSEHFCIHCNRLRLTAEGKLRPCLLSDEEIDLRPALRQGAPSQKIRQLITEAIQTKPRNHHLAQETVAIKRRMSQVGG